MFNSNSQPVIAVEGFESERDSNTAATSSDERHSHTMKIDFRTDGRTAAMLRSLSV